MDITLGDQLKAVYDAYSHQAGSTSSQPGMDGKSFAKMAKDCGLIDKHLAAPDVDLAFTKAKMNKLDRKIGFEEFLVALEYLSQKKGKSTEELAYFIVGVCKGPVMKATKTDNVRLHDDRSTYTGVYAQGGP